MMTVNLIRHGQTLGNQQKRYIGATDEPLLLAEKQRLEQLTFPPAERLFSSPLLRARETAAVLYPQLTPIIVEDFRECHFGIFENKTYEILQTDEDYRAWLASGGLGHIPYGENGRDFRQRSVAAFTQLITQNCAEQLWQNGAIIAHGGTIMAIMAAFSDHDDFYAWRVANGEGYQIRIDEKQWRRCPKFQRTSLLRGKM